MVCFAVQGRHYTQVWLFLLFRQKCFLSFIVQTGFFFQGESQGTFLLGKLAVTVTLLRVSAECVHVCVLISAQSSYLCVSSLYICRNCHFVNSWWGLKSLGCGPVSGESGLTWHWQLHSSMYFKLALGGVSVLYLIVSAKQLNEIRDSLECLCPASRVTFHEKTICTNNEGCTAVYWCTNRWIVKSECWLVC